MTGNFGDTLEGMGGAQKGNFDKMFHFLGLALTQECWKGISPTLDMGKTTKNRLDTLKCASILAVVCPVEFNNFGALFFEDFGALFSKRFRVAIVAITFPLYVAKRSITDE